MNQIPLNREVSLITPSFNQGQFLEQSIQSVLAQNYSPIEYFLIDGGSQDNSLEIIGKYRDRLAYWVSEPDLGQAHAINKGLRRATGDILGWLNSDDLLLQDTISRVVDVFERYPQIDVVYGRVERINEEGNVVPTPTLPKDRLVYSKQLVVGECIVNQPGSFWRRAIMEKVGYLDENLKYTLDYEYWIRIALAGGIFYRIPQVVAQFRLSSKSKTVGYSDYMAVEQLDVLSNLVSDERLSVDLDLSHQEIKRAYRKTRGSICLHAFYGRVKRKNWRYTIHWLFQALRSDPLVLFQWRWFDLAITGIMRRIRESINLLIII